MRQPLALLFCLGAYMLSAQDTLLLNDLTFWKSNAANWQIVGDVTADIDKNDVMKSAKGVGVLANLPDAKNRSNLLSVAEYGDVEVSFDFMMAKHSNSGFYLQGRYEVQLLDSWGHQHPTFGDCGGVYARRRWNPSEELFDGRAPRLNACLAPGLWQHMEIHFQAPRFDASGKKIANARLVKVLLNGALLHENLELTGPTGGPVSEQEALRGPFMIQGDHGPVAFRNFRIVDKGGEPVTVGKFSYQIIDGNFRYPNDFAGKKIDREGSTEKLTWEVAGKKDGFAAFFKGNFTTVKAGKHVVTLQAAGKSSLKINGKELLADQWTYVTDQRTTTIELPAGTHNLEIVNYKMDGWMPPFLGCWIEGPGARTAELHSMSSILALEAPDPIGLEANRPTVFRSFMDITLPHSSRGDNDFLLYKNQQKKRVVHAVQVGDPMRLHYTYDLDNGALAQVWKGGFLNASPMWDNRGDGSARPLGAILALDDIQTIVPKDRLMDMTTAQNDPAPGFKPQGYDLDDDGRPTFRYTCQGVEVQDQLMANEGKTIVRTLTFGKNSGNLVARLAAGAAIEKLDDNLWAIDGKRYFIQTPKGSKPMVATANGLSVLYLPVNDEKLTWSLMW